jgi:hypothetical protein
MPAPPTAKESQGSVKVVDVVGADVFPERGGSLVYGELPMRCCATDAASADRLVAAVMLLQRGGAKGRAVCDGVRSINRKISGRNRVGALRSQAKPFEIPK